MPSQFYQQIYRVVDQIPAGKVATYGQVAELAGLPGHARQVGYAMNALSENSTLPWHRVINAQGSVSSRSNPDAEILQKLLLEEEGISCSKNGKALLKDYQWVPVPGELKELYPDYLPEDGEPDDR